jgi:hypothetical protein
LPPFFLPGETLSEPVFKQNLRMESCAPARATEFQRSSGVKSFIE